MTVIMLLLAWLFGIARNANRVAAAVIVPATIPLGTEVAAFAQLAAMVALLVGALATEAREPLTA